MTNEQIILQNSVELMKQGIIGTTGRTVKVPIIDKDGKEDVMILSEPEPIHTYSGWKSLGYQVQKGQKAIAQFLIWKHVTKKVETTGKDIKTGETVTEEATQGKMFMKKASWFTASQVEPITEK